MHLEWFNFFIFLDTVNFQKTEPQKTNHIKRLRNVHTSFKRKQLSVECRNFAHKEFR